MSHNTNTACVSTSNSKYYCNTASSGYYFSSTGVVSSCTTQTGCSSDNTGTACVLHLLPSLPVQPVVFERIRFRTVAPITHYPLSLIVQSCDLNNIANAVAHADYSSCNNKTTNEICQPTCLTGYHTVTPASPIVRVRDQDQVSLIQAAHPTVHLEPACLFPSWKPPV